MEAKTILCTLPHALWINLAGGTGITPGPMWVTDTVPLNPFSWFCPWPRVISSQACLALIGAVLNTQGRPSAAPQRSMCSSLRYSVLWTFPDSQFCHLSSRSSPGSAYIPVPCTIVWKVSQDSEPGKSEVSPCLFIISQGSQFFIAWCSLSWKHHCFMYFIHLGQWLLSGKVEIHFFVPPS